MSLKGTKTAENLLKAFAGESQARNRYTYAASVANKEGYKQIAAIFEETADQEKEHAKRLFKFMEGGEIEITASYPYGVIGTTTENLQEAADGENYETETMYPEFAEVAEKEGFNDIAEVFRNIAVAEAHHRDRYLTFKKNIETGTAFKKDKPVKWMCRNCGYIHESAEAPKVCPACAHPQAHFQIKPENY
jgi:rubrerythrin